MSNTTMIQVLAEVQYGEYTAQITNLFGVIYLEDIETIQAAIYDGLHCIDYAGLTFKEAYGIVDMTLRMEPDYDPNTCSFNREYHFVDGYYTHTGE